MSARELAEWGQLYALKADEHELRRRGFTDEQLADAIEAARADEDERGAEGLVDALCPDLMKVERYLRTLEWARDEADASEDGEDDGAD